MRRFLTTFANINKQKRHIMMEAAESVEKKQHKAELVFPKIPKDYKPSEKVMAMTCGPLPKDFDLDKELDEMWEERAR